MNTLTPETMKEHRREEDISQKELAIRAGVASSTISRFESGEGNLSDETEAKILEYMTRTREGKSDTPGTHADTPSKNIIDDTLIDTIVNQVIKELSDDLETTIDAHMKNVRIQPSVLFTEDHTFGEMEQILTKAEKGLASEVKSIVRGRLDEIKHSV